MVSDSPMGRPVFSTSTTKWAFPFQKSSRVGALLAIGDAADGCEGAMGAQPISQTWSANKSHKNGRQLGPKCIRAWFAVSERIVVYWAIEREVPTTAGAVVGFVQRRNQRRNSDGRSEVSSPQTSPLRQATEVFFLGVGAKFHNLTIMIFLSRLPESEDLNHLIWCK